MHRVHVPSRTDCEPSVCPLHHHAVKIFYLKIFHVELGVLLVCAQFVLHTSACGLGATNDAGDSDEDAGGEWPDLFSEGTRTICSAGTENSCRGVGMEFNGAACCVDDVTICAPGSLTDCSDDNEIWTGAVCCVRDASLCTLGSPVGCQGSFEYWTGEMCCVRRVDSCTYARRLECQEEGQVWTGQRCCS
jgi:hypothetical protein